jgi:hypothetical protein
MTDEQKRQQIWRIQRLAGVAKQALKGHDPERIDHTLQVLDTICGLSQELGLCLTREYHVSLYGEETVAQWDKAKADQN